MIRDYQGQQSEVSTDLHLMRMSDNDLTLQKYLVYDDSDALDRIFAEQDRRDNL